jgi:hypothetical protein
LSRPNPTRVVVQIEEKEKYRIKEQAGLRNVPLG